VIGGPHAAARLGLKRSTLRDRTEKLRLLARRRDGMSTPVDDFRHRTDAG
jgi:hypothetical protein